MGLGMEYGKYLLFSYGNDGGMSPPPQGNSWRGVEELPTPTLELWENDWELTEMFFMLIDDIQNEKALDIDDNEEATLKG
jgi:hypothetical protein